MSFAISSEKNSTIYQNPDPQDLIDFSFLGVMEKIDNDVIIEQQNHLLRVTDAIYYDVKSQKFATAIAENNIQCEVCALVSEVIDQDHFKIITNGFLKTDRYTFDNETPLYLSDANYGKLVSIEPSIIIKQIATQTIDGIIIDIKRGFRTQFINDTNVEFESYTKQELDEIIQNIW